MAQGTQEEPISREEFRRWQQDRVTQRVMAALAHYRQQQMEGWANRAFEDDGSHWVAQGKALGYQHAQSLTAEDIEPSLKPAVEADEEPKDE